MNTPPALNDDDRIAAMLYVDGELDAASRAAFDARLAHEPALAAAVAREHAFRGRLQSAYAAELDEPLPAGLRELLAMPEPVAAPLAMPRAANDALPPGANDASRAHLPRARRWRWPEWGAMAASLVLGLVFGARMLTPQGGPGGDTLAWNVGSDGTITAQAGLRDALEQHVAGTAPEAGVAVGLSFRNHSGQYCRTFSTDAASGIACKGDGGWVVAHLEQAPTTSPASSAYRTAASPFSPALLAAVDALRDGETLDAAGEAAARAKEWKP